MQCLGGKWEHSISLTVKLAVVQATMPVYAIQTTGGLSFDLKEQKLIR